MDLADNKQFELSCIDPMLENYYMNYDIGYNSVILQPLRLEARDCSVRVCFNGCLLVESYEIDGCFIRISRTWTVEKEGAWVFNTSLGIRIKDAKFYIPSVLYRENDRGSGCFPRGAEAAEWDYMEERTPLPCGLMLYNNDESLLFFTEPASDASYAASRAVRLRKDSIIINTVIPGAEKPFSYTGKKKLIHTGTNSGAERLEYCSGEIPAEYSRTFYLAPLDDANVFSAYRKVLENLGSGFRKSIPKNSLNSWSRYFGGKIDNLVSLTEYDEKSGLAYLKMGIGNGELQNIYEYTSASFLVKSLEGACIYTELAKYINKPEFIAYAEGIGRFFLKGEIAPGVHQDCYDLQTGEWGGYLGISENDEYRDLVNSRCNGESMSSYVHLYEAFAEIGREVPEFIELPLRVARFYIKNQLKSDDNRGSFGRWWTTDGQPVNTLGTNGAYIVSFLLLLKPYYEDKEELDAAVEAAGAYYRRIVDSGDFFGDTLDADAYDKESGAVLLSMFLDLFESSRDSVWLEYAGKAADYLLTWIWQYDEAFSAELPLAKAGFQTSGMTSVSVAHHHLDFYGISIGYDFLRLWEFSGRSIYRTNGEMMINACRQLTTPGFQAEGNDGRCRSCQPEQINHTSWDYFDRADHGKGFFDICISWVTVLGLGAWLKIEKRFPDFLTVK